MSDSQPQTGTGPHSTESQPKSLQTRAAVAVGKVRFLPELIGWESIRRGMRADDEFIRRTMEANHKLIYGESGEPAGKEDEMGDIVLGDIRTEHHYPAPPAPPEPKKSMGLLPKLAIAGAAALGVGGPLGAAWMLRDAFKGQPEPTPIVQPAEPQQPEDKPPIIITEPGKNFDWRVGDPIVE